MSDMDFEIRIQSIAKEMDYPPTPDIAGRVLPRLQTMNRLNASHPTKPRFISRRFAWSLITILILFSSLFLIPPARAAIIEFIQIGIVRIFKPEATHQPAPAETQQILIIPVTATPAITAESIIPFLEQFLGKTTLEDATTQVDYAIPLPTYPADLGQPDYVFVQDMDGAMTVLVWLDPQNSETVKMSLHLIASESWAIRKFEPQVVEVTNVNGLRAVWTTGPYPILLKNRNVEFTRLAEGHVLIWADGDVTYRLETDLTLEEALKIAESLEPLP